MFKRKTAKDIELENKRLTQKLKSENNLLKLKQKNKQLKKSTGFLGKVSRGAKVLKSGANALRERRESIEAKNRKLPKKNKARNPWLD